MHISKWIIKNIPEELLISISFVIIVDTKKKKKKNFDELYGGGY